MRRSLLPGALALLMAACASAPTGHWYGPRDPQQRASDEYECLRVSTLGPGAPLIIPGGSTTIYGAGGVAMTIPGAPLVFPGSPERDWDLYGACLKARGWEYRLDEPEPTAKPTRTPTMAEWLLRQGGQGDAVERWPTETACKERHEILRRLGIWPSSYCVPASATPEPVKTPQPATLTAARSDSPTFWRMVATAVETGPLKACERAVNQWREQPYSGWLFRCESPEAGPWAVVGRAVGHRGTRSDCEQAAKVAVGRYPEWTFRCEPD